MPQIDATVSSAPPPVPAKDTLVPGGPTNLMLGMSSQASAPVPVSFLGNLNPVAGRPVTWEENVKIAVAATVGAAHLTYKPVEGNNFRNWTAGYSVVTLTSLQYTFYPSPGSKDMQISFKYCWVPAGETEPTNESTASVFPTFTIEYLQPNVAGSMPPPFTILCPIGDFELARNVKPKPLAGGVPQLYVLYHAHKVADGTTAAASTELGKMVCRLTYRVGM